MAARRKREPLDDARSGDRAAQAIIDTRPTRDRTGGRVQDPEPLVAVLQIAVARPVEPQIVLAAREVGDGDSRPIGL